MSNVECRMSNVERIALIRNSEFIISHSTFKADRSEASKGIHTELHDTFQVSTPTPKSISGYQ